MAKKTRSHDRAGDQTQISISLPEKLLEKIDTVRKRDARTRSNWIVFELQKRIEAIEAQDKLEKEGKSAPRIGSFHSTVAESSPREGASLNEDSPAHPASVPDASARKTKPTRTRLVMRKIAQKHKDEKSE